MMNLGTPRGLRVSCPRCRAAIGKPCQFYDREVDTHLNRIMREVNDTMAEAVGKFPCEGRDTGCDDYVGTEGWYCPGCQGDVGA